MKYLEDLVKLKSDKNCDAILEYIKNKLKGKVDDLCVFGGETKVLLAGLNTNLPRVRPHNSFRAHRYCQC